MSDDRGPVRKIPLPMFRRMLQTISAAELRRLPPEALPDEIPLEVLEEAPRELRSALEDLSLAVGSSQLSRWREHAENWGEDVATALDLARQQRTDRRAVELEGAVDEVAAEWNDSTNPDLRAFLARFRQVEPYFDAVREETARLFHGVETLNDAIERHGDQERLREARHALGKAVERVDQAFARYHGLHLELVRREMRAKRDEIEASAFEDERMREKLDALTKRLDRTRSLVRRSLRPEATRRERERLQQRITDLMRERDAREWVISERDMTRWLDAVVDASLYLAKSAESSGMRDGRLQLFHLLNMFCRQQEDAAQQVARNPFLQLDPEQAIEFLLISERFILGYFAQKRGDVTRWLGGAAKQRLTELDEVQRDIIDEYRKHRKRQ